MPAKGRARATPGRTRVSPRARRAKAGPGGARTAPKRLRAARARTQTRRPAAGTGKRRGRFTPPDPARVRALLERLRAAYPGAHTALDFGDPLQLLIATILSAQCTDERVNMVTPALFARFPDAAAFAASDPHELETLIRSTGFYRMKAKAIRSCCADIVSRFGGRVPATLEELITLRGVGRKTANVVLGNAYGIPGLVVDTHVARLAHRLGLTREHDAVKIEFSLMPVVPREDWTLFSHWLILHGRRVCNARKPFCSRCPIADLCPRIGVGAAQ
ncbi:MAG: endonuclease III [Candidatus Eisenbacteria bacterium]